jgi:RimJ/RimL family protein N-acetyltransferase
MLSEEESMNVLTSKLQPTIAAERFDLRPVRPSDAGLFQLYAGDERVARFTRSIPHPLPPGASEAFIRRSMASERSEDVWVLDGSRFGQSEVLGVIGLDRINEAQSEIGFWVVPASWNAGLASESVRALLAANPLNNTSIVAEVFQDNPRSAQVLTNAGFEYIGDAEAFCVARNATVRTWTYVRKMS